MAVRGRLQPFVARQGQDLDEVAAERHVAGERSGFRVPARGVRALTHRSGDPQSFVLDEALREFEWSHEQRLRGFGYEQQLERRYESDAGVRRVLVYQTSAAEPASYRF